MNDLYNDTFFINLFSTDSKEYHMENNESNFITQFEKHIELNRKMEVAILNINIPKICNIPELTFSLVVKETRENNNEIVLLEKNFRQDYITSEDKLNEIFNNLCQTSEDEFKKLLVNHHSNKRRTNIIYKHFETPKIYFIDNKIYYTAPKVKYDAMYLTDRIWNNRIIEAYWKIDNFLEKSFGYITILKDFIPANIDEFKKSIESSQPKKFIPVINHINVCSDIIESSLVGITKLNFLRTISKLSLDKNNNSVNFNPLAFVPVRKHFIKSINICLIDDKKNYILTEKGITTVVLLLRPIEHI